MKRLIPSTAALLFAAVPLLAQAAVEETRATLRNEILKLINTDRTRARLAPVELDPRISATADDYSRLQLRNGTSGHFTVDGLPPYARYSLAGGNDGLSENTASWSADYTFNERALYEMVRRSHDAMMGEQPPHDGHRRAILDPFATHVGIGLAWERGEFRITQHFVRRHLRWSRPLPRISAIGNQVIASATPLPGYRVEAVSIHHEPLPKPMTARVANRIESYDLPKLKYDLRPRLRSISTIGPDGTFRHTRKQYADGSRGDFSVTDDGTFSFEVPFRHGAGLYTVVVWLRDDRSARAFAASNVSIVVGATDGRVASIAAPPAGAGR